MDLNNTFFLNSAYFGAALTIGAFLIGRFLQKKTNFVLFNPILVGVTVCIVVIKIFNIDYTAYENGAQYVSFFLNIATISLAILLYEQIEILKKNYLAIVIGISSGVITTGVTVVVLSKLFGLGYKEFVTLLPHSVTTAMGMALSEEYGGYVSLTVASIIGTGIFGNVIAVTFLKLLRITDPVARGIAIGTSSHALGTAKALEIGEVEGAMSGLSIAVAGLITVVAMAVFSGMY